jgi:anaerobic selenocysteine-containing dehydrogenase
MSLKLDRRSFLQFGAGGAAGLATSGVTLRGISEFNAMLSAEQVRVPSGPERWSNSICGLCPAGCGLRVRTIGERAVSIQGNPLHPVNQGGLCPKGMAGLQDHYHPDRLQKPLRNTGTRASPRWQETSWEEAQALLLERLRKLRDDGQAHTVVLVNRENRGLRSRLWRRFLAAYGSPNVLVPPSGLDALQAAVFLQQGVQRPVAFDFENTRYLLSFGVNVLEGWGAPTSIMRAFGRWRDSAAGRRTKFVQAESRFSPTAAKADEWVAIRPGTEATLALGLAYALITEGLYNAAFVKDKTFGFEDWKDSEGKTHLGFRSLVMNEYRLNRVAETTGIPGETILRLAREFAQNQPGIALGDRQTSSLAGNPRAAMAVHSLNALMGSIDVRGGVLIQAESGDDQAESDDQSLPPRIGQVPERIVPGSRLSHLPQAILSQQPHPVKALLLHETNPVFSQPNGEAFRKAFQQVPFIASWSAFLDESSSMADLVLPIPSTLERWQDAESPPGFPYALLAIAPPVIPVRHGIRDSADMVLQLAAGLEGQTQAALPFENFEAYLNHRVDRLFAAQRGSVFAPRVEQLWDRLLEASGWWAPTYTTADELREQMKEKGGWWEPTYPYGQWARVCQTPSGRFEFSPQLLVPWARKRAEFAAAAGYPKDDDRLFLPGQPALPPHSDEFPLLLVPVEVLPLSAGEGAHLPCLQQIAGEHLFAQWNSWLEMHPQTANRLGISDKDTVWVESPHGRVQAQARLYEGVQPDTVHMPLGYGHTAGPQWSCRGANPLALLEEKYEPLAGLSQTYGVRVKVSRV